MNLESRAVARRGVEETLEGGAGERGRAHVGVRRRRRASLRGLWLAWVARAGGGVGVSAGGHDGGGAGRSRSEIGRAHV